MKTIIYIGGELPDKDASALRILANAKAIRDYGYNVVLISQSKDVQDCGITIEEYERMTIYYLPFPKTTKNWVLELFSIKQYIPIFKSQKNLVSIICYNPHSIMFEKIIRYGNKNGIAVVCDCTEWHTVSHLSGLKKYIKLWDITRRIKKSQCIADGIIAISTYFANYYNKVSNVLIIPPLVDKYDYKWINNHIGSEEVARFVYAGRMGIGKDSINECINAFDTLTDLKFHLDIVGVSYDEFIAQFPNNKNIVDSLLNKITFHGMLPHEQALDFVKKSSFSLIIRENNRKNSSGFPTKFAESITCGTPVIASNFSDVKEYVEKYNLGIMIDGLDSISDGLRKAITMDNNEYAQLRNSCLNCNIFDYRNYVNQLGQFIDKIVEEKNERR